MSFICREPDSLSVRRNHIDGWGVFLITQLHHYES